MGSFCTGGWRDPCSTVRYVPLKGFAASQGFVGTLGCQRLGNCAECSPATGILLRISCGLPSGSREESGPSPAIAAKSAITAIRMRTKMKRCSALFTMLLTSAFPLPLVAQHASSPTPAAESSLPVGNATAHPLQISAGDLVEISVFDTPDL